MTSHKGHFYDIACGKYCGLEYYKETNTKGTGDNIMGAHCIPTHKFLALGVYIVSQNTSFGWKIMFIRETSNKVRSNPNPSYKIRILIDSNKFEKNHFFKNVLVKSLFL